MDLLYVLLITFASLFVLWIITIMPSIKKHPFIEEIKKYHYAHRGLHDKKNKIPENSLASFERAIKYGFGIELDVHLTREGRLVVMHDNNLLRTCGIDLKTEDLKADDRAKYHLENSLERIPFLEEALALVDGRVPLIIDLKTVKGNYNRLCKAVYKALKKYKGAYCIESFDPRVLRTMKEKYPGIMRGQLAGYLNKHGTKINSVFDFALRNLLTNFTTRPHFISYRFYDRGCPSLRLCKAIYGITEIYWTIVSPEQMEKVKRYKAIAIFEQFIPED